MEINKDYIKSLTIETLYNLIDRNIADSRFELNKGYEPGDERANQYNNRITAAKLIVEACYEEITKRLFIFK